MGTSSGPSNEVLSEPPMLAIHRLSIIPGAVSLFPLRDDPWLFPGPLELMFWKEISWWRLFLNVVYEQRFI